MTNRSPEARKAARAARMWARVVPLGAEPRGDVLRYTTPGERLALVEELGEELRRVSGRPPAERVARGTPIRIIPLAQQ